MIVFGTVVQNVAETGLQEIVNEETFDTLYTKTLYQKNSFWLAKMDVKRITLLASIVVLLIPSGYSWQKQ